MHLARRISIFIGDDDQWHHRPLYAEIMHRAHQAGLAGATALRGTEGFGTSRQVHTTRLLSLTEDLPCLIIIVDTPDRIDAFLPQLSELIQEGTVVIDDVEIVNTPDPGSLTTADVPE
jgi:hypothetical protein